MTSQNVILIVGGYGEVGRRLAAELAVGQPSRVVVAGRKPERASNASARRIDVDDPSLIESALDGVDVVVACVRQREPHLLRAAVRRGIAYTSIAPPWLERPAVESLDREAKQTGARIVLAAGIEPGISSVLARVGADEIGEVDAVETSLLLGVGDAYGPDSMAFLVEELAQPYTVQIDGRPERIFAFGRSKRVEFPPPIGKRRAFTMPFRDQLYYPITLGAKTAVATLALEPAWLGNVVAGLSRIGARSWSQRDRGRERIHRLVEKLRSRYAGQDQFALVVEVRGGDRIVRSSLLGREQARATAIGAAAIAEALYLREADQPGVWLAEQVIAPAPFLARLRARGLVPVTERTTAARSPTRRRLDIAAGPPV